MLRRVEGAAVGVYRRTISKGGVKRASRNWYCVDPTTGRERSLKVTDKAIAEIMLGKLRKARELRLAGIETFDSARSAKPMALVEEYLASRSRARPRTLKVNRFRLTWFMARVESIADLTPDRIKAILEQRRYVRGRYHRKGDPQQQRPLGANSYNQYLETLSAFFRWLVRGHRWQANPVDMVERETIRGQAFDRWSLTLDQLEQLVDAVPIWRGAAYALSATAGLRRGELEQLQEVDLDLDAATLRLRAATTKADTEHQFLPLNPWVVDVLRRYLEAFPPDQLPPRTVNRLRPRGARLFAWVPTVRTVHRDLARIGLEPVNAAGEKFDLHALRTTFGTLLARAKVAPQVARDLMRHSDIRLTLKSYTKLTLHDHREAVALIQPKKKRGRAHGRRSG